jgi:hypothetical protein
LRQLRRIRRDAECVRRRIRRARIRPDREVNRNARDGIRATVALKPNNVPSS